MSKDNYTITHIGKKDYKEGVYYDRIGGNRINPSNSEIIETLQRHYNKTVERDIKLTKTTSQMNGYDYYYIEFNFKSYGERD